MDKQKYDELKNVCDMSDQDMANVMQISLRTLKRHLNGETDFNVSEINRFAKRFGKNATIQVFF